MQHFEFILPNEKRILYSRFALLLFVLSAVGMAINQLSPGIYPAKDGGPFFFVSLLLVLCQLFIVARNKINRYRIPFLAGSVAIAFYWYFHGPWFIGLLYLLLTLLFVVAQRELKVKVGEGYIIYPSFPTRTIKWEELNNLILKDGLLTIDFKNDKIIQQYPDLKINPVNEQEFNEFCREQLMANNK